MKKLIALFSILLVISSTSLCIAQAPKKVATVEGITEFVLDNGCRLIFYPDKSSSSVTVNMTLFVGSRHEGYGETGMAHLLEHMLFKGTPSHANIPKELKDRGVINMNGTTSYDRTNYFETLPASEENLEWAIQMEADRMVNSFVKGEDLLSEMTVVRNEFEQGENSPLRVLFQRILANAYEWHNYGKTTIGNRVDIERVPITNLRAFYRKYYRPDNAMVVVAGNFDPNQALKLCEKYFGTIENPKSPLPATYTIEPPQDGERSVTLSRVGDVPLVGVAYHVNSAAHPDYASVQVLAHILGTEPSGRLYQTLIEPGIASSVFSQAVVGRDPGTLVAMMEIKKDVKIEAATKILLDTIQAIGKDGVTEAEVKRAVTEFLKNRENLQANPERLAIQLSEWASYGDWRLFFLHRDRLEKVSPDDVKRVASDYLKTSNRTVGTFRPTKTPDRAVIPNTPDITNLVKDYKGRKSITEGESFESTPANIANRLVNGKFSSGVSYALLPKQTRLNRVFMRLTLRYGNEGFLAKNRLNDACDMLPNLWFKGTTSLTFQELQDKINELKASISVSGSTGQVTFNVSGRKETFSEVLKLLKDVLRNPAFPEDEFKILKSQSLTSMESAKSDPRYLGQIALMRKMRPVPKNNIRYVPTVEENVERIEKLSIGDIKEVYNRCLSGTVGEVTIVGAFDQEETITLVDDLLEDWKPEVPYQRIEDQFLVTKKDNISINTPDKKMAVLYAGTNLKIRDDDQDWEAMFIANNILGGGALANRLGERVRQKEGLSYGVGSMFSADSLDQVGRFMTQAITNPKNRDRLVEVIQEEYQRFIDGGVSPDELERAKTGYIEQLNGILGKDPQLLGILHRFQRTGRQPDFLARRLANVSRLTKTDVDRAIKKLLPLDRIVIVTAGDFENNPPATANDNPAEKKD